MNAVLLACVASTLFMVGLAWFVQVVHYPLFGLVGEGAFPVFHESHSRRTTVVVAVPMLVELLSSITLAVEPPRGTAGLALAGALLAVSIWALTAFLLAPMHGRIGSQGPTPEGLGRLVALSWPRTALWTAHGVVVLAILAVVLDRS